VISLFLTKSRQTYDDLSLSLYNMNSETSSMAKLSKWYTHLGHKYAYINPPISHLCEQPTTVLIKSMSNGERLIVVSITEEIAAFQHRAMLAVGAKSDWGQKKKKNDEEEETDAIFITVKKDDDLPPAFDIVGKRLSSTLPWMTYSRVALRAVRVVGNEENIPQKLKYSVLQFLVLEDLKKDMYSDTSLFINLLSQEEKEEKEAKATAILGAEHF
jgi:hypothetical protein